jgi:hypothetical protein
MRKNRKPNVKLKSSSTSSTNKNSQKYAHFKGLKTNNTVKKLSDTKKAVPMKASIVKKGFNDAPVKKVSVVKKGFNDVPVKVSDAKKAVPMKSSITKNGFYNVPTKKVGNDKIVQNPSIVQKVQKVEKVKQIQKVQKVSNKFIENICLENSKDGALQALKKYETKYNIDHSKIRSFERFIKDNEYKKLAEQLTKGGCPQSKITELLKTLNTAVNFCIQENFDEHDQVKCTGAEGAAGNVYLTHE